MTELLEKALEAVRRLPPADQDALAAMLMRELESERRWSDALARSPDTLAALADEALGEHRAGLTKPM